MRVPAPLARRLIGNGEGGGEQVLDWGAHGPGDRKKIAHGKGRPPKRAQRDCQYAHTGLSAVLFTRGAAKVG